MSRQITWPLEATRFPHYAVDELWYREPRLLVPGIKPIGPVKVDLSSTIVSGIRGAYIFNEYHRGRELLTGSGGTVTGTPFTSYPNEAFADQGVHMFYADAPLTKDFVGPYTVAFGFKVLTYDTSVSRPVLGQYANDASDDDWCIWFNNSSAGIFWRVGAALNDLALALIPFGSGLAGLDLSFVVTSDGTTVTAWPSGNTGAHVNLTSNQVFSFGRIWASAAAHDFTLHHFFAWDRCLSEAEARSILHNPYQFLVPA